MPALQAFGRRWHVGADDFVLPGICDLIIRISWFIATAVVYWQNSDYFDHAVPSPNECSGGVYVKYFLYGIFATLQLIIFSDIALVHNSKAGSVMDTAARKYVPLCLYIRTLLFISELALNIIGTYGFSQGFLTCPEAPGVENLIQGLLICTWLLVAFTFLFFVFMFDALGSHHYELGDNVVSDPKLAKCWNLRWRFLCLYWWTKNKDIRTAFREMGTYLAAAFESSDIVFSDLMAGAFLLYLKHREIKKSKLHSISICSRETASTPVSDSDSSSIDKCPSEVSYDVVEWPKTEEWNNLAMILHYYQYAVACYSWGVILCTSKNPLCALWKDMFCCGCIRKNPSPFQIEGDNCCFLHSGSAADAIRIENSELVYCSFDDKVYKTPFLVALDHGQKSIVVAIRGTMSRADVVTDIYVRPASLGKYGYPESFRAHQGMLMNAESVHRRLKELELISRLIGNYPGYKIVTTGTSLGSASATLLCFILRKEFPKVDCRCFAYSPSGALLNIEASKYSESFVTAVIYGDDFVARLAVKSVERLKYDIVSILKECQTPKYQILLGGLWGLCGGRPKVTFSPDIDSIRKESRQELISYYGFDFAQINVAPMEADRVPFYLNRSTSEHKNDMKQALKEHNNKLNKASRKKEREQQLKKPLKLLPFELMYPPGKLLHITETAAFRSGRKCKNRNSAPRWNIRWAERNEFREIIITPRMFMDHVPFRPNKALEDLTRRWMQSQEQSLTLTHAQPIDFIENKNFHLEKIPDVTVGVPIMPIDEIVITSEKPTNDEYRDSSS